MTKRPWDKIARVTLAGALLAATIGASGASIALAQGEGESLKFGMILVGPKDDRGWSQAHYEAGLQIEEQLGGEMILQENAFDLPGITVDQVARDMIEQGAELVFFTSFDFQDGAALAAEEYPDVAMIWSSGDSAWSENEANRLDLTNLGNVMGRMDYGKMIAGCTAALASDTGSIGYVGPLINDETRQLVNAAYLGAKHCWENVKGNDPADLDFEVTWIGYWFNKPGETLDPTLVSNTFIDGGADVLISGIDTTEALVVAGQRAAEGETVWAVPYDYVQACDQSPDVCLGTPYFSWAPSYLEIAQSVIDGAFEASFQWLPPNWDALDDPAVTPVGYLKGPGLDPEDEVALDDFIAALADGSLNLWTGPLNNQDGTVWLEDGATATEKQIWNTEQLLEGITGSS
jgi:simple sugar transport system substrate-binding protein